ncbi:putative HTH-type transcriptional regulator SyrM [Planktothrix sp. PCC 11201]|uniref:LysR family transcriptional regulator n=1 Tax=Planktothrix sp. PCC 11201 TaxID=1729650 RepID=UPI000923C783|nr:LysR family transcriptional regulator [Planktothrix sp. PCC 11201]SKB15448.1 putative HTH-type transcriptional regulator SyrM [Planktothrix sp. PCC 11201]
MQQIDIKQIDLNLLTILKVLLEEVNVTKASQKLNLSQSATSHALKRLRKMFNDPLLERSSAGMRATPRALALQASLESILLDIEKLVTEPVFIPELARGTIRIAASDYATTVILPSVLRELSLKNPYLDIECYDWHPETLDRLKSGEIDLALGIVDLDKTHEFGYEKLFTEDFVSIVRVEHPIIKKGITLESYIASPHALITITGLPINSIKKSSKSHVDRILEELGVERRVRLKLPHFLSAALIVGQTDMILTLPRRIALIFASIAKITIFDPPIDLGQYNYMQIWSKKSDHVPFQIWLRDLIRIQTQDI